MQHPTILEEVSGHNVTKLAKQEGQTIQIANLRLTWKARGGETGYQFSIYEMSLAPDIGIPLHKHPYAEFFYVLEGTLDFARMNDKGAVEWITCSTGESVIAPPNAPHTFHNHSSQPGKFMSVSNYYHEVMLNAGGIEVKIDDPHPAIFPPEVFERFAKASAATQVYVVEP